MRSPGDSIVQVEVDYEATWLASSPAYSGASLSQDELDETICNIMRSQDQNIPSSAGFENKSSSYSMNTGWGVATSGVMMFNGIAGSGVDPFYPAAYGRVTDPSSAVENVD